MKITDELLECLDDAAGCLTRCSDANIYTGRVMRYRKVLSEISPELGFQKVNDMAYGVRIDGAEILGFGWYKGYLYVAMNIRGSHPCGYVDVSGRQDSLKVGRDDYPEEPYEWIDCHGGITYAGDKQFAEGIGGSWIGFDYMHLGDRCGGDDMFHPTTGKEYSVEDVAKECRAVIDQCVKHIEEGKGDK